MDIPSRTIIKVLSLTVLFGAGLWLVYIAHSQLVWIGTAFFFAVALNSYVEAVTRYMPRKSRGLAIGVVFLVVVSVFAVTISSILPPLIEQSQMLLNNLPHYTDQLAHGKGVFADLVRQYDVAARIRESQEAFAGYATSAGTQFFGILHGLFSSFIAGITIIGLTFFMLMEGPKWTETFWRLVPDDRRQHAQGLASRMYRAVTGYVNGNLLTSLIAALTVTIMLMLVRVPYAVPLGILVGILDLLPLVGATIGAVVVVLVALFTSPWAALIMTGFFLVYQQIENHLLQPIVYGKTVEISPLVVLIAVIIGSAVGGIIGAIVAIPVFASLQILIKDFTERHLLNHKPQAD